MFYELRESTQVQCFQSIVYTPSLEALSVLHEDTIVNLFNRLFKDRKGPPYCSPLIDALKQFMISVYWFLSVSLMLSELTLSLIFIVSGTVLFFFGKLKIFLIFTFERAFS